MSTRFSNPNNNLRIKFRRSKDKNSNLRFINRNPERRPILSTGRQVHNPESLISHNIGMQVHGPKRWLNQNIKRQAHNTKRADKSTHRNNREAMKWGEQADRIDGRMTEVSPGDKRAPYLSMGPASL